MTWLTRLQQIVARDGPRVGEEVGIRFYISVLTADGEEMVDRIVLPRPVFRLSARGFLAVAFSEEIEFYWVKTAGIPAYFGFYDGWDAGAKLVMWGIIAGLPKFSPVGDGIVFPPERICLEWLGDGQPEPPWRRLRLE